MIFGLHRETVYPWDKARPLGNGPAFENTIQLKPQVKMQSSRIMLLNDELSSGVPAQLGEGFLRFCEVAFFPIWFKPGGNALVNWFVQHDAHLLCPRFFLGRSVFGFTGFVGPFEAFA